MNESFGYKFVVTDAEKRECDAVCLSCESKTPYSFSVDQKNGTLQIWKAIEKEAVISRHHKDCRMTEICPSPLHMTTEDDTGGVNDETVLRQVRTGSDGSIQDGVGARVERLP